MRTFLTRRSLRHAILKKMIQAGKKKDIKWKFGNAKRDPVYHKWSTCIKVKHTLLFKTKIIIYSECYNIYIIKMCDNSTNARKRESEVTYYKGLKLHEW